MTLTVRDEQDILRANLEHHLAQGVDHVIVTDNRSEDDSREIAAEYERAGVATVIDERRDDYDQSAWVTRMARMAATDLGADWVINNDADEFWFAPEETLAAHLASLSPAVTVVDVPRHDLLLVDDDRPWHERLVYRYVEPLRSDGTHLPSKVCHRADPEVVVHQGNHSVAGPSLGDPVETGAHILHAQLRSRGQRSRKAVMIAAAYERNQKAGPRMGHQVRALAQRVHDGEFEAWWQDRAVDLDQLTELVLDGQVVVDHRVRDVVRALEHSSGPVSGGLPSRHG